MSDTSLDIDELYAWIDTIPLSRPKKNISRDFADGGKNLERDVIILVFFYLHFSHHSCIVHFHSASCRSYSSLSAQVCGAP